MSASPRVERVGDLVVASGYRPSDASVRSPDGGTVAIAARDAFRGEARPLGTWVIDLAQARVVTFVPAPGGLRSIELLDADTLCALGDDGVLRVHALPDGGCDRALAVPGARWITAVAAGQVVLAGDGGLTLAPGGDAFEPTTAGPIAWRVHVAHGTVAELVDGRSLAALLSVDPAEARRHDAGAALTPWWLPSPDGLEFAVLCDVSDRSPRPWTPGDLDEASWTHPVTFRPEDPLGTLRRWAAPLEGWSASWWDPDTLSGVVGVATGPPPYRTIPMALRRVRRDGSVLTWRPPDTDLLDRPCSAASDHELDDGGLAVVVCAPGVARLWTLDPVTRAEASRDLLAGLAPPSSLHPTRPVIAARATLGDLVLALPLGSGETAVWSGGRRLALLPAALGAPDRLEVAGAWVVLEWHPPGGAPWRRAWLPRDPSRG